MARKKKKIPGWKALLLMTCLMLLTAGLIYGYIQWNEYRVHFVRYKAFGIDIPVQYHIHGIDVSHHQDLINWEEVKKVNVEELQLSFAFIKATEGLVNVDRLFRRNWYKAREEGVTRGAYHFFLATKSGKKQAENFIAQVTLEPGDLPPVLDVEQLYGVKPRDLRIRVQDWLNTIEAYYKVKPIIYTNVDFYEQYLGKDFDEYPLWVAHYLQPNKPRIKRPWIFWQHSETGKVDGIGTRVDFNVFNGDASDFQQLLLN
ncbi:MAG: glycoside hydrolase family 25 protein [Chitinophagaceae bacterium]|nr:glycoside hydrolase family 25 protein [Chitinophagaceae bacterium]